MKFRKIRLNVAQSDCGSYEIRGASLPDGKSFWNAWHVPTEKHIEASYDKELVKRACAAHSERVTA